MDPTGITNLVVEQRAILVAVIGMALLLSLVSAVMWVLDWDRREYAKAQRKIVRYWSTGEYIDGIWVERHWAETKSRKRKVIWTSH